MDNARGDCTGAGWDEVVDEGADEGVDVAAASFECTRAHTRPTTVRINLESPVPTGQPIKPILVARGRATVLPLPTPLPPFRRDPNPLAVGEPRVPLTAR
jgi:hypothetical protein